jgi:hypothetical protein
MASALRGATFTVRDAAAAAERFGGGLGYLTVETGRVDTDLARSWKAPQSAGRAYALCQPASGADVYIRFVEGPTDPAPPPFRTWGWAAAELCVQDVVSTHAHLSASPFEILGAPERLPAIPTIFPMQIKGPDEDVIYLTEILTDRPDSGLPKARVAVDRPFILVLGCRDLSETAAWFGARLNLDIGPPLDFAYELINSAFALPAGTRHRLATARTGGAVCLEFDQLPAAATPRPGGHDTLPPGMAIGALAVDDFDVLRLDWTVPPWRPEGKLYAGGRLGVARTPDGALLEVIERL